MRNETLTHLTCKSTKTLYKISKPYTLPYIKTHDGKYYRIKARYLYVYHADYKITTTITRLTIEKIRYNYKYIITHMLKIGKFLQNEEDYFSAKI